MKWAYLIIVLALVSGCVSLPDVKKPGQPQPQQPQPISDSSRIRHDSGTVFVDMIARQWEFVPDYIEVKKGDTLRIEAQSVDTLHSIAIPDLGIEKALEPGKPAVIEFIADREGEYGFKSTKYSGIGFLKMKGKIVVTP
ncbi:MAG: cupredoxin domain-containing protein [Nanoarchaeota archaeon]|mgnify:CR=1 FL=1